MLLENLYCYLWQVRKVWNVPHSPGKRLVELRKAAGLTQKQLGGKVGVSNRVIHYYEGETDYPPAHLVEPLARALSVSTDELLGVRGVKQERNPEHAALWRRLKKKEGAKAAGG